MEIFKTMKSDKPSLRAYASAFAGNNTLLAVLPGSALVHKTGLRPNAELVTAGLPITGQPSDGFKGGIPPRGRVKA